MGKLEGAILATASMRPISGLIRDFPPELDRRIIEKQGQALEAVE